MRQSGWLWVGLAGLVGCSPPALSPLRSRSSQRAVEAPAAPDEGRDSAAAPGTHAARAEDPEIEGAPTAATEADDEQYDYRGESLGALHFGMTSDQIEALLGAPRRKSDVVEQAADGLFVSTWDWPAQGVSVELAAGDAAGPFEVHSLAIRAPSRLATARGIGLGARVRAIVQAYGADHTHVSQDSVVVGSPYGGLHFELEHGTVRSIFIGAAAE